MSSLVIDGRRGMQMMVAYLVSLGHRKLIFLGMERGYSWAQERISAFTHALAETELRGALVLSKFPGETAHEELLCQLVRSGYTGVVCLNDDFAAWAINALQQRGLRVPQEASVTGFDDDYLYRQLELTTLGYPLEELGGIAINTLARQLYEGNFDRVSQTRLAPLLVRRGSTAAPRDSGRY